MRLVDDGRVEVATRALLGAIDTGDGGTEEQRGVLAALVTGYWGRPDVDLTALEPLGPDAVAERFDDEASRRRLRELMVLLELCRHPLTDEQVALVDRYTTAMGQDGDGLRLARTLVRDGTARALADYRRFSDAARVHWAEPSLVEQYLRVLDEPDPELAARLTALHDLPEDTLGWAYVEFYRRQGLALPGVDTFEGKEGVMAREGAAALVTDALRRGASCTDDFSEIDHLELAHLRLADVRARFGVPPLDAALLPAPT